MKGSTRMSLLLDSLTLGVFDKPTIIEIPESNNDRTSEIALKESAEQAPAVNRKTH